MGELERNVRTAKIQIVRADITKEMTDSIVNAANSHLAHGGGVALSIVRAGGPEVNSESRSYVTAHGPVPTGEVAVTSGGNLPAKYIFHAVGPVWGEGDEDGLLAEAFRNSLKKADELGLKSISFPAVSSGIYGFPKDRCAEIFYRTVKRYFETVDSGLTIVRMCLYSGEDYGVFAEVLERVWKI